MHYVLGKTYTCPICETIWVNSLWNGSFVRWLSSAFVVLVFGILILCEDAYITLGLCPPIHENLVGGFLSYCFFATYLFFSAIHYTHYGFQVLEKGEY